MKNRFRFLNGSEDIPACQLVADLRGRNKIPQFLVIQGIDLDTAGDPVPRLFADGTQRTLNTVVNRLDEARGKLYRQRRSGRFNRFSRSDSACFLVHLNGRTVAAQLDNLADQMSL